MDRTLRAFLAVVRVGNLTAAADQIGLTQPALTKTIRRLEAEIGSPLFARSAKGMALTEIGELFLERARAIETHWAQAREEAHARSGGGLSEFRMASGAAYHMRIAPLLVRQLSNEFPETRFLLDFDVAGAMMPKLLAGEIHLLLGAFAPDVPEGLIREKLLDVQISAMCCRSSPLADLDRVPPATLRNAGWVIYKRDSVMQRRLADYYLQFSLPAPKVVMEVDALASSLMIVQGTSYLTAAPDTLQPMAEEAGLVVLPLEVPIWSFPSGAWLRRATREYPIMQRALALLRELTAANLGPAESHSFRLSERPD